MFLFSAFNHGRQNPRVWDEARNMANVAFSVLVKPHLIKTTDYLLHPVYFRLVVVFECVI